MNERTLRKAIENKSKLNERDYLKLSTLYLEKQKDINL
jgi:hypothetical protein